MHGCTARIDGSCLSQSKAPNLNHCPTDFLREVFFFFKGCSESNLGGHVSDIKSQCQGTAGWASQAADRVLPKAQASVTTGRVNAGKTVKEKLHC